MAGLGGALLGITRPLQPLMPRMLPRLVIIGAQKAGTTTLYDLLAQHPQVIQPRVKEVSFFSNDEAYAKGMAHYRSFFPRRPLAGRAITFDASPMYLYHELAAERIARHLPRALCLAILRDPVEHAYSAWNMYRRFKDDERHARHHDPRSFEDAVAEELSGAPTDRSMRYLDRGTYLPQLQRYLDLLGKQRLMVTSFERFTSDPGRLVNAVLARLGLKSFAAGHAALLTRSNARPYELPLDPALRDRLSAHFANDAQATRAFIAQHGLDPIAP